MLLAVLLLCLAPSHTRRHDSDATNAGIGAGIAPERPRQPQGAFGHGLAGMPGRPRGAGQGVAGPRFVRFV